MKEVHFKANDFRGKYPQEMNEHLFYAIGKELPVVMKARRIAVGRDIRLSSNSLFAALAEGLSSAGCDVLDLGQCDTPYTYFISGKFKLPCLMITASHNPKEYNGLKMILPGVKVMRESQIAQMIDRIKKHDHERSKREGKIIRYDKKSEYVRYLLGQIDRKRLSQLKIVIDCSNAMASTIVPYLLQKTPAEVVFINLELDGDFPGHIPNPAIPSALSQLQAAVKKEEADIGIMYDGDCDRVAFVDETGEIIDPSIVASIFAHSLLENNPGKSVLHTVTASRIFPETIELYGGEPIPAKIGHRFMKESMRKENAIFGAEPSGHYYFQDYWYADSGILASLKFYGILSQAKTPASLLRKTFQKYTNLGEMNYHVKDREKAYKKVVSFIKSCKPDWESALDGYAASKMNDEGHMAYATIRKSNTEPVIRITVESDSEKCAKTFKREIDNLLRGA